MTEGPIPDVDTNLREQAILNRIYDDVTKSIRVGSEPTSIYSNSTIVLSLNAAGDVVQIDKTLGSTTYTKTISNVDQSIASTKTISAWS